MTIKTFGELEPGDRILGTDGKPVEVLRVYEEHVPETMYRLEAEDGSIIEASGNHLWYVESSIDRALHRRRIKEARKVFSSVDVIVWEELEELTKYPDHAEIALSDIVALFEAEENPDLQKVLIRTAESLGPVAEEKTSYEDLYDSTTLSKTPIIRLYDARLFSQQLLALSSRKWEKKWPIVKGQVMTTDQLSLMALTLHLPEVKML